jgi:hypothetical protein
VRELSAKPFGRPGGRLNAVRLLQCTACCLGFQIFPPLVLGATQRTVALPTQGQKTAPGAMAVVTGWGATHVSTGVPG